MKDGGLQAGLRFFSHQGEGRYGGEKSYESIHRFDLACDRGVGRDGH